MLRNTAKRLARTFSQSPNPKFFLLRYAVNNEKEADTEIEPAGQGKPKNLNNLKIRFLYFLGI